MNGIADYCPEAVANPGDTAEFPEDEKLGEISGACLVFSAYGLKGRHAEFGLLAIIEIHRSELEYARKHGSAQPLKN
jgi:hypothetical protein